MRCGVLPEDSHWLIAREEDGRTRMLVIDHRGEGILPIFSHEKEAESFLSLESVEDPWQPEERTTAELVSVLHGPCADVPKVALDPLPEMVEDGALALVSLVREHFVEHIATSETKPAKPEPWLENYRRAGVGGA